MAQAWEHPALSHISIWTICVAFSLHRFNYVSYCIKLCIAEVWEFV
jgi:hypothetical protein